MKKREVYRLHLVCHYGLKVLTRQVTSIISPRARCEGSPLILGTSRRVLIRNFSGIDAQLQSNT